MDTKEFETAYDWVKEKAEEYESLRYRTAVIAGFFGGTSGRLFTGEQVKKMLDLRFPKKD